MSEATDSIFSFSRAEAAMGRVVITPDESKPYKVVFRLGERLLSEHPVTTVREGEALIRRELSNIQFSAQQQRPDPEAPKRHGLNSVH